MKTIIKAALVSLFLPLMANAAGLAQYKEGVHYEVVSDCASIKPEVKEFFSFYCPACNNFEGLLADLKPMLDKNIKFKKSHVDFMGGRTKENQQMLSQALATASTLPQKDKIVGALFNHYHGKRNKFNSVADIKDIFVVQGVDGAKFDKLYKSFSVRTMTSKMKKDQDYFKNKGGLNSVPTFIVNGKYKLLLGKKSGVSSAETMNDLISYLAKK